MCLLLRGRVQHMLGARFAVMRVIAACILNMQIPSARALDILQEEDFRSFVIDLAGAY